MNPIHIPDRITSSPVVNMKELINICHISIKTHGNNISFSFIAYDEDRVPDIHIKLQMRHIERIDSLKRQVLTNSCQTF